MNPTQGLAAQNFSTGSRRREHRSDGIDSDRVAYERAEKKMGDVDASDRSGRLSSVVFPEDCEFFDEIDDLHPYSNDEGDDELVADPT